MLCVTNILVDFLTDLAEADSWLIIEIVCHVPMAAPGEDWGPKLDVHAFQTGGVAR